MDIIIVPFLQVMRTLLWMYNFGLFLYGILLLLESFGVIGAYDKVIYRIHNTLFLIYNPALEKVRSIFNFGTIDFSVFILFLTIHFISHILQRIVDLF